MVSSNMLKKKWENFSAVDFILDNLVSIIFLVVSFLAIPVSGLSAHHIIAEILTRIGRNSFLVFALILPIMAGMGINFGMVLGAMAGQIGLIFAMDWRYLWAGIRCRYRNADIYLTWDRCRFGAEPCPRAGNGYQLHSWVFLQRNLSILCAVYSWLCYSNAQ